MTHASSDEPAGLGSQTTASSPEVGCISLSGRKPVAGPVPLSASAVARFSRSLDFLFRSLPPFCGEVGVTSDSERSSSRLRSGSMLTRKKILFVAAKRLRVHIVPHLVCRSLLNMRAHTHAHICQAVCVCVRPLTFMSGAHKGS